MADRESATGKCGGAPFFLRGADSLTSLMEKMEVSRIE